MATSSKTALFLVLSFLAAAPTLQKTNAEDHDVGDDTDWQIPTDVNFYSTWAAQETFRVGDTLEFEFTTGLQDVAEVTKEAFDACNTSKPISLMTTGPATVFLNATGARYFICTLPSHCARGQKLAINVVSANAPPTPSEDHDVGDDADWQIPNDVNFYANWAARQIFRVGDTLEFEFTTGLQDVAEVTKEAFDACNTSNPISLMTTGSATVFLNATGARYFICTLPSHCARGQKLAINVVSVNTPPTSSEDHDVGDDADWQIPNDVNFYANWAARQIFRVGDTLEFDFTTGAQDVAVVTKAAFDTCNTSNPISLITTGPATIILNATGAHYYICTLSNHCSRGQKLAINVGGGMAPPTPTTPASPGTPNTTAPTSPANPASQGNSGTPARASDSSSSASSVSAATLLVMFMYFGIGLFW